MAGWDDLVSYVRVRYEVMRQAEDELWFNLPTTGDRTQLVVVRRVTGTDGEPWAQIASPICKVGRRRARRAAGARGGVGRRRGRGHGGVAMFRHSVPLDEGAVSGFDRSFHLVVDTADKLEEHVTGADVH